MGPKYDAVGKDLLELDPAAWLAFLGHPEPPDRVSLIDADLSATVTTATDKVISISGPDPWLVMVELHTYWDGDLPYSVLTRYALLRQRHHKPVSAVVLLLRPEANATAVTGSFDQPDRLNGDWKFPYALIQLWKEPVDRFLTGPLGLVPLAPLARIEPGDAPRVKATIADRLTREAGRAEGDVLRLCLFELLGLRYDDEGVEFWRDIMVKLDFSKTYLAGLVRNEARRDILFEQGTEKFGPPPAEVREAIEPLTDEKELRRLLVRVLHVESWAELLAR